LEKGDIVPILQGVSKANPEIPRVPLATTYAKTEDARQLIELGIHSPPIFVRPYILPPGTPKERVQILRNAFQETLKDNELLAEMKKAKLSLSPVMGEELQKVIATYFKHDPALLAKLKDIIYK
jgi:tripartite-type tricarboxylate transporter receptor subunit TctC